MFLIEYDKNKFVDGEELNWISIQATKIQFTLRGSDDIYLVDKWLQQTFVNNLKTIHGNMNIESIYIKLNKSLSS